jgi:hypothetical protein
VKKKVGLLLPEEIVIALERAAGKSVNGKQKWVAYSAALLLYSMAPAPVRSFFLRSVWGATIDEDFADLLRRVESGEIERELQSYLTSKRINWSLKSETPAIDELRDIFPGEIVSNDASVKAPAADANSSTGRTRRRYRRKKSGR